MAPSDPPWNRQLRLAHSVCTSCASFVKCFIFSGLRARSGILARQSHRHGAAFRCGCVRLAHMIDPKLIDDLARRLAGSVPEGLRTLQDELVQNFRPVLQSALSRLDLVTREEFDVQAAVLAKARKQLDTLLTRLDELEQGIKKSSQSD